MKNKKLKNYAKSALCLICTMLCVLSLCIYTNAEDVEEIKNPLQDFEGPYNMAEFSENSSVFSHASMETWLKYFYLQETSGMLLNRRILAVGVTRWNNAGEYWQAPCAILSGIESTATNENYAIKEITLFSTANGGGEVGSPFPALPTGVQMSCAPYEAITYDDQTLTATSSATSPLYTTGRGLQMCVMMESGGVYVLDTTVFQAGNFQVYARRKDDDNWERYSQADWDAWRTNVYGMTDSSEAPVVKDYFNTLYEYVNRIADINYSFTIDVPRIIEALANAPRLILGPVGNLNIFGIAVGGMISAVLVFAIIVFIVKKFL